MKVCGQRSPDIFLDEERGEKIQGTCGRGVFDLPSASIARPDPIHTLHSKILS